MRLTQLLREQRGVIAILIGLCAIVLFGFVALVIDIGYGLVTKNALQNVADAAALAATRQLGRIYVAMTPADQASYVLTVTDCKDVKDQAGKVALMNYAAGKNVTIDNVKDIEIGKWDATTKTFMACEEPGAVTACEPDIVCDTQPDAVRVTARRDGRVNGPLHTFFAGIIGQDTLSVTARATAALSGLGYVKPGTIETPVGISEKLLDCSTTGPGCFCGDSITFSDTKDSCAGWTTFHQDPNTPNLLDILDEMINGEDVAPAVQAGKTALEYTGGNLGSQPWSRLKELYDKKNVGGVWTTTVVVYEEASAGACDNPNDLTKVVGFAKMNITNVLVQPYMELQGNIACNTVEDGRGGGSNLGVLGSIPNLVQ